jgi:nucleotide-binding universal stress UspA family protein
MRPDLIIQGSGGVDDLRRPFLGSIAEEVLRLAGKPVLTVPGSLKFPSSKSLCLERILLATDFGSAVRTAAQHAFSFAEEFGSRVYLCHVTPNVKDPTSLRKASAFFEGELQLLIAPSAKEICETRCVVKFGRPAETILKLAASERCDLIVLGAYAPGPLRSRGRPGTVFSVIAGAHCPVLTIPSTRPVSTGQKAEQTEFIEI